MSKYLAILESAWNDHLKERGQGAPNVISLFAGCGGSSLGYSMAGFRELLAVEWDNNAVETFKLNFPDVPVYHGDIAKCETDWILQTTGLKVGELDVLDGSPPCQGFSTAGKRVLEDPRNSLFKEYVRILRGLMPKVFVMENVSGMVKGKMKLVFAEIMRELKASGYKVSARLMNTMYFNVPQSRQRMIFIGVRNDLGIEPSHPRAESKPFTVGDAFENIPVFDKSDLWWKGKAGLEIINSLRAGEDGSKAATRLGKNSNSWFNLRRVDYRLPGFTITKASGGSSLIHPDENRILSVEEYKRIASFPDDYVFVGNKYDHKSRIGNSVPPLFMRAIANHIRAEILSAVKSGRQNDK